MAAHQLNNIKALLHVKTRSLPLQMLEFGGRAAAQQGGALPGRQTVDSGETYTAASGTDGLMFWAIKRTDKKRKTTGVKPGGGLEEGKKNFFFLL